jgi:hypothetical protein
MAEAQSSKWVRFRQTPANNACSGLGGGPRFMSLIQAKAFFRFDSWFSHQAAKANR